MINLGKLQNWVQNPWLILGTAISVRVLLVFIRHTYVYPITMTAEEGCIAQSLATGHGFSSVFCHGFAPTAWEGPVYPVLVSLLIRLFGLSIALKAAIVLTNALFSALLAPVILKLSRYVLDPGIGMYAAWGWAVFPIIIASFGQNWGTATVWDTNLSALLLGSAILLSYTAVGRQIKACAVAGALWALVALTNVSCLSILPFCLLGLPSTKHFTLRTRSLVVAGLAFLIPVGAWMVRNRLVFHEFIFLRSNLGVELRIGNSPFAAGWTSTTPHPLEDNNEMNDYLRLGEIRYSREAMQQAWHFMLDHPGLVSSLAGKRVRHVLGRNHDGAPF